MYLLLLVVLFVVRRGVHYLYLCTYVCTPVLLCMYRQQSEKKCFIWYFRLVSLSIAVKHRDLPLSGPLQNSLSQLLSHFFGFKLIKIDYLVLNFFYLSDSSAAFKHTKEHEFKTLTMIGGLSGLFTVHNH